MVQIRKLLFSSHSLAVQMSSVNGQPFGNQEYFSQNYGPRCLPCLKKRKFKYPGCSYFSP